jgi:Ras-related protein Rab-2A
LISRQAGQEVFKSITRSYYRGSIGAILMYDITSRQSFNNLARWIEETRTYSNEQLTILLVGNKNDLTSRYPSPTQARGQHLRSRRIRRDPPHALPRVLRQEPRTHLRGTPSPTQAFIALAREVLRKIENSQIDPRNEVLGVKLGSYNVGGSQQSGGRRWYCC